MPITGSAITDECRLVLHVGLPKCGSSALQAALSKAPDPVSADGRRMRYTAPSRQGSGRTHIAGRDLMLAARGSVYGYAIWHNMRDTEIGSPTFARLHDVMVEGRRDGVVPIASSEGWVRRPHLFARHLESWGNPPVDVVAFLRPPVDWMNAAYWQWGVWDAPTPDRWLPRADQPYDFGVMLEHWARIPNVRLRLASARSNVVKKFSDMFGLDLPAAQHSNAASPPALIGFLLRNRQLRPTAHNSSVEFVFQRWCEPIVTRKPWAFEARHIEQLRPLIAENRNSLLRIASKDELADILSDSGWDEAASYQRETDLGPSPLDDRAELAALYDALRKGAERACHAAHMACPPASTRPLADASLDQWDQALRPLMETLVTADEAVRRIWRPSKWRHIGALRRIFGRT